MGKVSDCTIASDFYAMGAASHAIGSGLARRIVKIQIAS
jgi:hypothetical protein